MLLKGAPAVTGLQWAVDTGFKTTCVTLQWRHNDHHGIWNHQLHGRLLNRLFRRRSKKTSKLRVTGFCVGNSPGPVNSPHKGPVTQKMFPFDDVIMKWCWIHAVHIKDQNMGYIKWYYILHPLLICCVQNYIAAIYSLHMFMLIVIFLCRMFPTCMLMVVKIHL